VNGREVIVDEMAGSQIGMLTKCQVAKLPLAVKQW